MNNLLNIKTPAESVAQLRKADFNLSNHSIGNLRLAYWNLATEALYEEAVFRGEGVTSVGGPFIAQTGKHTARSANDKFVVRHCDSENNIWWGTYNRPFAPEKSRSFQVSNLDAIMALIRVGGNTGTWIWRRAFGPADLPRQQRHHTCRPPRCRVDVGGIARRMGESVQPTPVWPGRARPTG